MIVLIFLILVSVCPGQIFGQNDSSSALCCHECLCAVDPTPSGVMISHIHKKNQWMVSYRYMHMEMNDMLIGTKTVADDYIYTKYLMSSGRMKMDMHMLMVMYGLTKRLTLMGMFNYANSSMTMKMLPGTVHVHNGVTMGGNDMDLTVHTSGISDFKIQGLYGLVNKTRHHLLLSAGISIPVGNTNIKGGSNSMYNGERLPYAMQLGSGTFDLLPGISYLYQKGKITWSSQITSVIRLYNNNIGYRFGNEVVFNNWFSLLWAKNFSSSLRMEGSSSGHIKGSDPTLYAGYEPAANPYNYGGEKMTGYLGTNFHFRRGFLENNRIGIEYGMPFYQNLYGPQLDIKSSLYASWSINL
jgi:hypothetical protein